MTSPSPGPIDSSQRSPLAEPPRRGWWIAGRFLLAGVTIAAIAGGATAAVALNEVGGLVEALRQNKPVKVSHDVLAPSSRGAPQTLLLVGNDERPPPKDNPGGAVLPHSNEMLLVRIDPRKPTISMLSIPRELQVPILKPDGEVEENRINAAYTYGWENGGGTAGGVKLMLQTIKRVLGISVNHVFVTNFKKFERAVNAMGCTYMTIDKRYFHSNSEPGAEQYMEINLKPGYQRVCGKEAREFVSNRHESTSLIRDSRDQRFLLEVKAQYGSSLFEEREKFERIFGRYVESTLAGEEEILQLLYLLAESAGKPVRQVAFHVTLGPTLDTATAAQIHEAVHSLLTGTTAIHTQRLHISAPARRAHKAAPAPQPAGLSATPEATLDAARQMATAVPFPVQAPLYQQTTAESAPDEMRPYEIDGPHGRRYPAYVIVVSQGELGQYYDVQGSTWTKPPLLGNPNDTLRLGARTYSLFYDGEHLKTVSWSENGDAYWVENTLTNSLSPQQMVDIARQTRPVVGQVASRAGEHTPPPSPAQIKLPPRTVAVTTQAKLAVLLGLVGLVGVAVLTLRAFTRQRELQALRRQMREQAESIMGGAKS
jgi:polyisoprenyl-teichoic acid--peptidoglycan teichoic acid transferase